MSRKLLGFLSLLFLTVIAGCDNENDEPVDTTPPTVSGVTLNDASENIQVIPRSSMHFDAYFEDNVLLGQYKIDVHNDFDGHEHGRAMNEPFEYTMTYDLIGKTQTVHEDVEIPEDTTPGAYHFTLQYFDAAGNEGELVVMEFIIVNPESQPIVNIFSPNIEEEIEIAAGESFMIEGTATDADGLEEVHIMLGHEEEDNHEHGRVGEEEPLYEAEYALNSVESWNFQESEPILIPVGTEPGHYKLSITVLDLLGNPTKVTAEVHVE